MRCKRFALLLTLSLAVMPFGMPRAFAAEIPYITDATYPTLVETSPVPVLVQFDAKWCPYCRGMQPALKALNDAGASGMTVVKIDVDDEPDLAAQYQVRTMPTLVVIQNGAEFARATGALKQDELFTWVAEMASEAKTESGKK